MKVRRRIVLVEASVKRPLAEDETTFIQSITANNLGEVLSIKDQSFTLQFGARKTRESDIERSLLVSTAIREHIEGVKFGLAYGLVSVTEKKDGSIKLEGPLTRKVKGLLKIAGFGQISVDQSITKIYSRIVDIRHINHKGKDVYNVFGFKETPSRIRGLKEAYTKLIGRDKEFAFLQNLIYQIAADQGQIVGVVGEAGIGKTRFTHELKTLLKMRGLKFYEGSFPYFGGSAYKGFKDIVSEIANIQSDDPLPHFEKRLRRTGQKYGLEDTDVNFLINLYTIEPVSNTLRHLNEEQIRLGTFVAIKKLLFAIAEDPLIIILEDMQNADELSAKLTDFIAEGLPNKKLLFFMNYRPEYHGECEKKIYFNEIKLKRFDEAKAKEFLKSLLDLSFIPKQIVRAILKKSAGNPLYIEELVRSLLDNGKIEVVNNEIKLKEKIETDDIQPTIHGVISYRMEKLPKDIRKTLQWAACIGDEIDIKLLKTILERNISKDIEELEIRDFIVERSIYPEEIYKFRHDLIREVAYESLSPVSKKKIHLKIANYLEKKFKREIDENLEVLAHHYTQSSDYDKGFNYAYKTAQILKENYANEKAIDLFQKAFDLVDKAKVKDKRKTKMQILEWMKDVYVTCSQHEKALEVTRQYKTLTSKSSSIELAKFHRFYGEIYRRKGDYLKALEKLNKALRFVNSSKNREEKISILKIITFIHSYLLNEKEAKFYAKKTLRILTKENKKDIATVYSALGIFYEQIGDIKRSLNYANKALRTILQTNDLESLSVIYLNAAIPYYHLGNLNQAAKFWHKSLELSKKTGNYYYIGLLYQNLGVLYLKKGLLKNGFEHYELAKNTLEQCQATHALGILYSNIAYMNTWAGDNELAKSYLEKSKSCFEQSPTKMWIYSNLIVEGKIAVENGSFKVAEKLYDKALNNFLKTKNYSKAAEVLSEIMLLQFYTTPLKNKSFYLNTTKEIALKSLTKEGYEHILIAKLKYLLVSKQRKDIRKTTNLIDNLNYEIKLETLILLSTYFKLNLKNKDKALLYKSKAMEVIEKIKKELPKSISKKLESKRIISYL